LRLGRLAHGLVGAVCGAALAAEPEPPAPIRDNSFLVEEAYNQEPGVIQHIQGLSLPCGDCDTPWLYTFTEEWPMGSQRHQASATLPVAERPSGGAGVEGLALNYRWQAAGLSGGPLAVAPRISLILPALGGDDEVGPDEPVLQVNLPLSLELGRRFVTHGNAGWTWNPRARSELGDEAETFAWNLGASLVWLAAPRFNVLLEAVYVREEEAVGDGRTAHESAFLLNPGVRFAIDRPSGLQIVPGISFPTGVGPSEGETAVLLYLSLEHPLEGLAR
jgi:hypothetical protein